MEKQLIIEFIQAEEDKSYGRKQLHNDLFDFFINIRLCWDFIKVSS